MNNINDLFAPKEIAILIKDMGFNDPCIAVWRGNDIEPVAQTQHDFQTITSEQFDTTNYWVSAPMTSQIINWFEDTHNIQIRTFFRKVDWDIKGWSFTIINYADRINYTATDDFNWLCGGIGEGHGKMWDNKTDALNRAIMEALKIIKSK